MDRAIVLLLMAGAAVLLLPPAVAREDAEDEPDCQAPDIFGAATSIAREAQDMLSTESEPVKNQNQQAFLWAIRVSEATDGPNGYRTIVGGSTFDSYVDHHRVLWCS